MKNCTFFLFVLFSTKIFAQCTPPVGITVYNNTTGGNIICPNSSYMLLANPNNVGPYQWTKNGVIVPSTTYVFPYNGNTLAVGDIITCAPASNLSCPASYTVGYLKTVYTTVLTATPSGQITPGTSVTFTGSISDNHGSVYSYGFFINGVLQNFYQPTNQRTFSFTTSALANGDIVYCTTQGNSSVNPCGYIDTSNSITASVSSILPVTLSSFNVFSISNKFLLHWTTITETNAAFFNIQESIDGHQYANIGKVEVTGNGTVPKQYSFDYQPFIIDSKPHFFRLQIIDKDDKATYSTVQSASFNALNKLIISPNPATNFISIIGTDVKQLKLFNTSGKLLMQQKSGQSNYQLNVSNIARGIYLLQLFDSNGQADIHKIILQ